MADSRVSVTACLKRPFMCRLDSEFQDERAMNELARATPTETEAMQAHAALLADREQLSFRRATHHLVIGMRVCEAIGACEFLHARTLDDEPEAYAKRIELSVTLAMLHRELFPREYAVSQSPAFSTLCSRFIRACGGVKFSVSAGRGLTGLSHSLPFQKPRRRPIQRGTCRLMPSLGANLMPCAPSVASANSYSKTTRPASVSRTSSGHGQQRVASPESLTTLSRPASHVRITP